MALIKLRENYPNHKNFFDGEDIKDFSVYSDQGDKIGSVADLLVDDQQGQFRYLIVDLGFWIFGKKVLLPVGRTRLDQSDKRIYATGMSKDQAENLPEFDENMTVDYDYEERVRGVYRGTSDIGTASAAYGTATPQTGNYDRNSYSYDRDRDLYDMSNRDHQTLKLYEERLIADKHQQKVGEVKVGKHIETEQAKASVPLSKEKVIIERSDAGTGQAVATGKADFQEGEVARMEIHEEVPDIRKEAYVREEVKLRKEVEQDSVDAKETLRREELDLDTSGRKIEDRR